MTISDEGISALVDAIGGGDVHNGENRTVTVEGKVFALEVKDGSDSFRELTPAKPALAQPLTAHSLGAVLDYLKWNKDQDALANVAVHVVGPREVRVVSKLRDTHRDRETYLVATPANDDFQPSQFLTQDDFVLKAQTCFVDTEERARLLELVGNLTDEAVRTAVDDGVTQLVGSRVGVRTGTTSVRNPFNLIPRRSFAEVNGDMTPTPFVLRISGDRKSVV